MEDHGTKEIIRKLTSMDKSLERIAKALESLVKINNRQVPAQLPVPRNKMLIDPETGEVVGIGGYEDETDAW